MAKRWEIGRVSTPEHIFDKLKRRVAQPVGIIVFGVDCDSKSETVEKAEQAFGDSAHYLFKAPDTATLVRVVGDYPLTVVTLNSEESSMHDLRHELVKLMRNAGVKTVAGLYVKEKRVPIRPLISSLEKVEFNKQITAIEQSNPTADGLDYFVVVSEEEEG